MAPDVVGPAARGLSARGRRHGLIRSWVALHDAYIHVVWIYMVWTCGVSCTEKCNVLLNFSLIYTHAYIYVANAKVIYKVVTLFVSLT